MNAHLTDVKARLTDTNARVDLNMFEHHWHWKLPWGKRLADATMEDAAKAMRIVARAENLANQFQEAVLKFGIFCEQQPDYGVLTTEIATAFCHVVKLKERYGRMQKRYPYLHSMTTRNVPLALKLLRQSYYA